MHILIAKIYKIVIEVSYISSYVIVCTVFCCLEAYGVLCIIKRDIYNIYKKITDLTYDCVHSVSFIIINFVYLLSRRPVLFELAWKEACSSIQK